MLMKLKAQGITILVSTPYMDEATRCDRIALIMNGEFMQVDTPQNIIANYPETLWAAQTDQIPKLLKELRNNPLVKSAYSFGEAIHVTFNGKWEVEDNHFQLSTIHSPFKKIAPTIEDCFMLLSKNQRHGK
jgi:ABC-type multidrug transport system ATPase subunit